jgi:cytochrome c-type biogenesis protein CcmH/NrfF
MRNELNTGMKQSSTDDAVLDLFVQKYGPIVLAAPTMNGFDRVAWITPYATFALGLGLVTIIVRKWRHVPLETNSEKICDPELEERRKLIRKDTEL